MGQKYEKKCNIKPTGDHFCSYRCYAYSGDLIFISPDVNNPVRDFYKAEPEIRLFLSGKTINNVNF